MATDVVILVLRLAMVALLYAFILYVVAALRRELGREAREQTRVAPLARLLVLEPGATALRSGQEIPVGARTSIGRDRHNTLVLADPSVSGRHAALVLERGTWLVRDLGSTNGTLLNERPVDGEATVEPGDVLQVGRVRVKLAS